MLDFSSEVLIYESLKVFHSFFSYQNSMINIKLIQQNLYGSDRWEENKSAIKILIALFDLIDIDNYKPLFLSFYPKLLKINFKSVS